MKKIGLLEVVASLFLILFVLSCKKEESTPVIDNGGPSENKEISYLVRVRSIKDEAWKEVVVYKAKVKNRDRNGECSFVTFDDEFQDPVEVEVTTINRTPNSVRIRPSSYKMSPSVQGDKINFKLDKPSKISLEVNGSIVDNILIFANKKSNNDPKEGDPNVIYYGPGTHNAGEITLSDNQTVYIEEGAVVYGHILAKNSQNIRIIGRGILDGSLLAHAVETPRVYFIHLQNCRNVLVEGIIIRDAPGWGCVPWNCEDVTFRNIKQISYNYNSDGFDICNSRNILIDDVFVRNWDDNISIKAFEGEGVSDITMKNSTLWADNAHNMLVGPEMRGKTAKEIVFQNIDVLENTQDDDVYPGVMAIMAADGGKFEGIRFENIRVENITAGKVICLQYTNVYSESDYGVYVRNVIFKDITYNGNRASKSRIFGLDKDRTIENISIENFSINGKKVTNSSSGNIETNNFVTGLVFK